MPLAAIILQISATLGCETGREERSRCLWPSSKKQALADGLWLMSLNMFPSERLGPGLTASTQIQQSIGTLLSSVLVLGQGSGSVW